MWLSCSTYYLYINEIFMTSSVVLCDSPNTSYCNVKSANELRDSVLANMASETTPRIFNISF